VGGLEGHPCSSRLAGFLNVAHEPAFALALRFFSVAVADAAAAFGPATVRSWQPNFNNELEARYPQLCDIFVDYSTPTLQAYRRWLSGQNEDVQYWARRWRRPIANRSWEDARSWRPPTAFAKGHQSYPELGLDYWDWQRFRELNLVRTYSAACHAIVRSGGAGCFLHFAEFFTSIDAMHTVPFFALAREPALTDIILDSNFMNFAKGRTDPSVASLLVSAAQPYAAGRRIWFESAVERLDSVDGSTDGRLASNASLQTVVNGFQSALAAGAHGLGVTNLLSVELLRHMWPSGTRPDQLQPTPWAPSVALAVSYESFYSYFRWERARADVMQTIMHKAFRNATQACGGCQVLVVGDAAMLSTLGAMRGLSERLWLPLPGVEPRWVRSSWMSAARSQGGWRVLALADSTPLKVLPVMARGGTVQPLADCLIAGTPKGGTSSLFEWLSQSAGMVPSVRKEINFFDRNYGHGVAWYSAHWPPHKRGLRFEATPGYIYHPQVPARVAALLPHVQVVFLLRDPAERAFSDHTIWARQGITSRSFETMVHACVAAITRDGGVALQAGRVLTDVLATDCPGSDLDNNDLCGCIENIVAKGLYAEQLRRWAAVLPRAQLLALDSSELRSPSAVLSKLSTFLGLRFFDVNTAKLGAVNTKAAPINLVAGQTIARGAPMGDGVRVALAAFYRSAPDYREWLEVQSAPFP
jgi:hypothetical protein